MDAEHAVTQRLVAVLEGMSIEFAMEALEDAKRALLRCQIVRTGQKAESDHQDSR